MEALIIDAGASGLLATLAAVVILFGAARGDARQTT